MNRKQTPNRRLTRIRIATALPLVAIGLTVGFIFLFVMLYLGFNYTVSKSASNNRAQAIAATIAPDTAWREIARLDHFLLTDARNIAAVVDQQGQFLAGNQSIIDDRNATAHPIIWHGEVVGTLISGPQVPFKPSIPYWVIIVFGAVIILATAITSRFFGLRISRNIDDMASYINSLSAVKEPPKSKKVEFAELSHLRVAIGRGIQRAARESARLRSMAFRDTLTGLPSHARLMEVMDGALQKATYEAPSAFIYLDIEGYRRANEALGGANGQQLLVKVADRLREQVELLHERGRISGTGHILTSLQGEGFGLFLPFVTDRQEVSSLVRALSQALASPFNLEGRNVSVSISGGIALAPEDSDLPGELIRHANMALQQVRKSGRAGFQFFTPRLDRQIQGKFRLETELMAAVRQSEFVPVFQPKIDLQTGKIIGAEALARWKRESGKIISPGAFIPLAEEIGLIEEIGRQILNAACKSAAEWMESGYETSVAVNVSPRQFKQENFTDIVIDALKAAGLPPRRLELEVTESMAVSDPGQVTEVMRPLRAMGVRLAIDDFGTGHSNLSMLTQLPFDVFKIDRQFVSTLQSDKQAPAIVDMILAMAETLGLETVAEGVETPLQADFLRRRGCTLAQGFYYSAGLSQADFMALLRKWERGYAGPESRAAV